MSGVAVVVVAALISQTATDSVTLSRTDAEKIHAKLRDCDVQHRAIDEIFKAAGDVVESNNQLVQKNRELREANQALILSQEGGTPWKPIAIVSLALSVVLGGMVVKSAIDAGKKNP